jgi:uncharacterized protein (DUF433 family)
MSEYITRAEAAQLSGASASAINKAIEQKVIPTRKFKAGRLLDARDLGAVWLLVTLSGSGLSLPVTHKRRLRSWLRDTDDAELVVAPGLVIRRVDEVEQVLDRASRYVELRERYLETNPKIRGGEPVIRGTRVPIRGLAKQVEGGETLEVLREDYPNIPDEAFEFAVQWAEANPRRGRPANRRQPSQGQPPADRKNLLEARRARAPAAAGV